MRFDGIIVIMISNGRNARNCNGIGKCRLLPEIVLRYGIVEQKGTAYEIIYLLFNCDESYHIFSLWTG